MDFLEDNAIPNTFSYTIDAGVFPWPLAQNTSPADAAHYRFYGNFISAPSLFTDWSTGNGPSKSSAMPLDGNAPNLCDGDVAQIMTLSWPSGATGIAAMLFPSSQVTGGDWEFECAMCGENFTGTLYGAIAYNTGKRWTYKRAGTTYTRSDPSVVQVFATTSGDDITLSLQIRNDAHPASSDAIDMIETLVVPGVRNKLTRFKVSISSGAPYEAYHAVNSIPQMRWVVVRDVTIAVEYGDYSKTITNQQWYVDYQASPSPLTNVALATHTLYTQPRMFSDKIRVSVFSMAGGVDTYADASIAWDRNYLDYAPPGFC